MKQSYHSNAATNVNIRTLIQDDLEKNIELACRFNISRQTVAKWKKRNFTQDASSRPLNIKYSLSELTKAVAISLRKSSGMPLDEVWEVLLV